MRFNRKFIISLLFTITSAATTSRSSQMSEACKTEMINIEKCISSEITKDNINLICTTSKSNECQQFYTNPMSLTPSCQNISELISVSTKIFSNSLSLMCETDEEGNICPFTEYEIVASDPLNSLYSNMENSANADGLNAIKNTCTSEKCKAATKKYLQFIIDNNNSVSKTIELNYKFTSFQNTNVEVINNLKRYIEFLNGNECKNATTIQANQLKSDQISYALAKYIAKPTIISLTIFKLKGREAP
ncbi:hypothetical protein H8356DRAFT_1435310 [Neocallimastix lanati (nom. inval.)]|nr:hypothetical protein H8356DRAFT_1435310 [Neocallimastix sp. JGI-2020a]